MAEINKRSLFPETAEGADDVPQLSISMQPVKMT
jgi:hypothetical protein